jgi:hypothetical protein
MRDFLEEYEFLSKRRESFDNHLENDTKEMSEEDI